MALQNVVDAFIIPAGIGRIRRKVSSEFSNFKAEQWKNWTLPYSIVCFKSILSNDQYSLWVTFANACELLCSRMITYPATIKADQLIHKYCCLFQQEFGKENNFIVIRISICIAIAISRNVF